MQLQHLWQLSSSGSTPINDCPRLVAANGCKSAFWNPSQKIYRTKWFSAAVSLSPVLEHLLVPHNQRSLQNCRMDACLLIKFEQGDDGGKIK